MKEATLAAKATDPTACEVHYLDPDNVTAAQGNLVDSLTAAGLAGTFQALADPTRVRIISALMNAELCVCDLAAVLGMTQSAISHQLRLLRDLRLVKARRQGRMAIYAIDDEHIHDLFQKGLEHVEHKA